MLIELLFKREKQLIIFYETLHNKFLLEENLINKHKFSMVMPFYINIQSLCFIKLQYTQR